MPRKGLEKVYLSIINFNMGVSLLACPNCHKSILIEEATFRLGAWRHRKCWEVILKIRDKLFKGEVQCQKES